MVRITAKAPLEQVWLNGKLCRIDEAHISVLDRGFLYGDGVYEIIPVHHGAPLQLQRHLDRLCNGLAAISIDNPHDAQQWQDLVQALLAANKARDASVYIQVTRGAPAYRDHAFPTDTPATVFAMCSPLPRLDPELARSGVRAITRADTRWARRDIKSVSLLANVLLRQEAADSGAAETILYDGDQITEGSASSVLAVINDCIVTPPDTHSILPGTTRDLLLDLAHENGLVAKHERITRKQLQSAQEVWLCSSLRGVLPVCRLDDQLIGDGQPGPIFKQIHALYQQRKKNPAGSK